MSRRTLPILPLVPGEAAGCWTAEPFALMVLGDSMQPEFADGDIIIVEPEGLAEDGRYVLARVDDDWVLRQLVQESGGWSLHALNPAYPPVPIDDLAAVRGVVLQRSRPGRRHTARRYID